MCGIVGVVNYDIPAKKIKDFIQQSLIVNSLRGTDGSGFCLIDNEGEQHQYKRPLPGWDLFQLFGAQSALAAAETVRFGMVHTRSGTSGVNTIETAHPINNKHITLIHNGLITNLHSLGSAWNTHDTAAAAQALADKTEKEALELFQGAYTLIWYNALDKTLNMARNDKRPLFIGTIKKSKSLMFASESGMLSWIADRNNINIRELTELSPGTHLKIPLDKGTKQQIIKYTVATVPVQSPMSYSSQSYYTPIIEEHEFIAEYVGELTYSAGQNLYKFKLAKDSMYGWVVDVETCKNFKPEIYTSYKLKAIEGRTSSLDCTNKRAIIVDQVPIVKALPAPNYGLLKDFYKCGNEVFFIPETIFKRSKEYTMGFVGYTDDGNYLEVKGFQIFNPQMVANRRYRAKIKSVIFHQNRMEPYILVEPDSIVEIVSGNTESNCDIKCGWCDADLSPREALNNTALGISNSGSLCDTCFKQCEMAHGNNNMGDAI